MKSIKSISIAIAISFLSITACIKSNASEEKKQNESPQNFSEYLGEKISKSFIGTVVDENKNPLENVTITIGNKTAITDSIGHFEIKNTNVNEHFPYLEAKKQGYENNTISIVPKNEIEELSIILEYNGTPCLFWFCRHNHSLTNSSN